MYPESVEIKVNVADGQVAQTMDTLGLADGRNWRIHFCEDVTAGVTPGTPLLEVGVVLRARSKGHNKGDSTVKLRPCRWSQLDDDHFQNQDRDNSEFKVEADWGAHSHSLAASLTAQWEDNLLGAVLSGAAHPADLFSPRQRKFLENCAREQVNLAAITVLPGIEATRWDPIEVTVDTNTLSIRVERWTVPGLFDYLELSIISTVPAAEADQQMLGKYLTTRSITPDTATGNKTERVLRALVNRAATPD
jgi:hypothetical protein